MGQEILPPHRTAVTRAEPAQVTARVPGVHMGGVVGSKLATWHHERQSLAIDALTRHNRSEVALFNTQTSVVEADIKLQEKLFLLQELPERLGHELALRRVARLESFTQAVHEHKQHVLRREMEETYSQADLTRARTVAMTATVALVDAKQQLQAQRDHGHLQYVLGHERRALEIMDVELDQEERKALLKKHRATSNGGKTTGATMDVEELKEALHRKRQELNAAGMPTDGIDAAIQALEGL